MNAHRSDEQVLHDRNRQSFEAENDHSREALEPILADDFKIIRSNWLIDDKQGMLSRVHCDTSRRTRRVVEESIKVYGDSAVVTSRVRLEEEGRETQYFWNTKVFVKRDGQWQCVVWQVARIP
jgi:hypothetical protein